jgi:polysaccharide biosynthesis protein PslH
MKILMIGHFVPYPPSGGSLQRSYNLLSEIAKENSVTLLALNQIAILPDENSVAESVVALNIFCNKVKVFKIPTDGNGMLWYLLLIFNMFSSVPYSVWRFKSKALKKEIIKQLQIEHFDIIHLDTIDLAQYADLFTGIPIVLNHHNAESQLLFRRSTGSRNPLMRFYLYIQAVKLKRYEKNNINRFNANLVVSPDDGQYLKQLAPNLKFDIIPNGTDTEFFFPKPASDSHELIFTGGMGWYPNRDAMIYFCGEILPLIKQVYPDVIMNIIGRKPPKQVKQMAKDNDSIKLYGFVKDIRDYVAKAAVYVVPIRVGGGTRLKILDAFASGKALVSTSVGCEGISVMHGENILIADSPEDFANNVILLFNDKDLRKNLAANARKLVEEKYAWPIIGEKLRQILIRVAK